MNDEMQLLLRYAAFVAILWLELKGEILNSIKENAAAFCTKSDQTTSFPISPPEFYIPWVWDAVYDMRTDYVDVTTLPQLACEFNKTILHRLIQLYPQYSPQLGDGVDSNVLVKGNVDKNKFDFIKSMINARMMCVFYSNGIQAHRTISLPVNIKRAFAAMSTAQIQCPVPPKSITWDSLRIERNVTKVFKFLKSAVEFSTNRTSVFPVCKLHHTDSTVSNASESESGNSNMRVYEYELSICTATQRSSREKLVEWIEYHLLQGKFSIVQYR